LFVKKQGFRLSTAAAIVIAAFTGVSLEAHITPVVIMRKQADVIRASLPNAARYTETTVHIGKPQLQEIVQRGHFTPDTDEVKFYAGLDASGQTLGTVLFPQFDTMHGPIEVGVAIGPDGAVTNVMVTRATVEMKPWVLEAERSGVLSHLIGVKNGPPKAISEGVLGGMPGYMADLIAKVTYQALALYQTLHA
jgi:hypothetical protein